MSLMLARSAGHTLADYDALPYDCLPFPQTHPARLATLARLFRLDPPELETCRVLELGCANGNNLVPMAAALPNARFVGVDLSARQIADGWELVAAAGLTNIELRHADLAAIDDSDGVFDYIIAHGVYSWVPADIGDKVLEICSENLAPNGVAYISYNTMPGWATNGMLREMMRFHTRNIDGPAERMRAGRELLDFLAGAIPDTPYGRLARDEIAFIRQQPDAYVAHDHMADFNEPVYFHEFAERAAAHGMKYLAEAEFSVMGLGGLPAQTIAAMRSLAPDLVAFEQLTDILRHRAFRQTLLVHDEQPVDRRFDGRSIQPFAIASPVTVAPPRAGSTASAPVVFTARNGSTFGIGNALTRSALLHLIDRWPEAVPFRAVHDMARPSMAAGTSLPLAPGQGTDDMLGLELLQLYAAGIIELRSWDPGVDANIAERPMASRLARVQAQRGGELTTLLHQPLALNAFERALVPLLDGSRDGPALLAALRAGGADAVAQSAPGSPPSPERRDIAAMLNDALRRFAKAGVLMRQEG